MAAALSLPKTVAVRGRMSTKPPASRSETTLAGPVGRELPIADIALDVKLQPRDTIDDGLVAEYAEALASGAVFPPVTVFAVRADGRQMLADGWHRLYAHRAAGRETIRAEVIQAESLADALRHSLKANARHGKRRDDGTLARSYKLACEELGVDPCDKHTVRELLEVSDKTAERLTDVARKHRKNTAQNIVRALDAGGVPQGEIARMLAKAGIEVARQTVTDWIAGFALKSKSGKTTPDIGNSAKVWPYELEMNAEQIKAFWADIAETVNRSVYEPKLKAQVEERVAEHKAKIDEHKAKLDKAAADEAARMQKEAAKLRDRAERMQAQLEAQIATQDGIIKAQRQQIADLGRAIDSAEEVDKAAIAKATAEMRAKLEDTQAKTKALRTELARAKAAAKEALATQDEVNRARVREAFGPESLLWALVDRVIEAVDKIPPNLEDMPCAITEHRLLALLPDRIAKLQAVMKIAERHRDFDRENFFK